MEYKLMAKCEHCGNEYDKTFEVTFKGKTHLMAPVVWRAKRKRNAIDYVKFFSRSHDAVIRVYDDAGNVIAEG
jgi:hypothetical protein